jgi:hypothetical protein
MTAARPTDTDRRDSLDELAPRVAADAADVRRYTGLFETFGPDMPLEARRWADAAAERNLAAALAAHVARIPDDLLADDGLADTAIAPADIGVPEPWGEPASWTPVASQDELDALCP